MVISYMSVVNCQLFKLHCLVKSRLPHNSNIQKSMKNEIEERENDLFDALSQSQSLLSQFEFQSEDKEIEEEREKRHDVKMYTDNIDIDIRRRSARTVNDNRIKKKGQLGERDILRVEEPLSKDVLIEEEPNNTNRYEELYMLERDKVKALEAQYKYDMEQMTLLNKDQEKMIDDITHKLEISLARNESLSDRLNKVIYESEVDMNEVHTLRKTNETLRGIVGQYLTEPNYIKKRTKAEEEFWNNIATSQLLNDSEPPDNYPYPEEKDSRSWNHLIATLKRSDNNYHRLQRHYNKLQIECDSLRSSKQILMEKLKDIEYKTEQRLKGSVRRINYAIEEKNKLASNLKEREAYIIKLELKLLDMKKDMNILTINNVKRKGSRIKENKAIIQTYTKPSIQTKPLSHGNNEGVIDMEWKKWRNNHMSSEEEGDESPVDNERQIIESIIDKDMKHPSPSSILDEESQVKLQQTIQKYYK